jgi:cobalt-precorrin-5B (C1)-methyltransferase
MKRKTLRQGYTTGACATAAAKGAALMLRDRCIVHETDIVLPGGQSAHFTLHGQKINANSASCFVIKDAGDDPDVTNGAEIHVTLMLNPPSPPFAKGGDDCRIVIEGGVGVGRVTKPGLAVPPGEWAINRVPRHMITEAVNDVFASGCPLSAVRYPLVIPLHVVISIPNGEELAKKTLNARLGIIGGLSILGTTGIVKPISAEAWTDTIEAAIDVALACGCGTIVLSTGRTSEIAAQRFFCSSEPVKPLGSGKEFTEAPDLLPFTHCPLPEESFVMMGDHVGFAVRTCVRKRVKSIVLAGQFAKLLKIACGHEQTHVSSSRLDLQTLADWLKCTQHVSRLTSHVLRATTAREILEASGRDQELISLVCGKAAEFAQQLAPGLKAKVFLAGYGGEVLYYGPHS